MSPTSKRIYLTRHGQAEHNATMDWEIRDAVLTKLGREQCRQLDQDTIGLQKKAELIVCSPLRRTMETMLLSYPKLLERKTPILLDILQEVGDIPCDTPLHPLDELQNAQGGIFSHLDFSTLSPDYASKQGIFDPDNVIERAKQVRQWLRDRPEHTIVVVAHGDVLRYIVDGENEGRISTRQWANCEVKVFTFPSDGEVDEGKMKEVKERIEPEKATDEPTTGQMVDA